MTTNIIIILLVLIALLLWEIEKSLGKIARRFGDKKGVSFKIKVLAKTSPTQFMIEPADEVEKSAPGASKAPHPANQIPSIVVEDVP